MTNVWDFKFMLVTSVHQCAILTKDDVCIRSRGGCIIQCKMGRVQSWRHVRCDFKLHFSYSPHHIFLIQSSLHPFSEQLLPRLMPQTQGLSLSQTYHIPGWAQNGLALQVWPETDGMALSRLKASSTAHSLESNNPHLRLLNLHEWVMSPHPQPHTPMSCLVAVTKLAVIHDTRRRMCGCTIQSAFLIVCGPTTCWNIKKLCILPT